MSTQTKNGNGLAGAKPTTETKTAPTVDEQKTAIVKPLDGLQPLEDRLHRLNFLFALQHKYNRYQTSLARLKDFELSKEDDTCSISFTDKNRNSFSTSNPELMPEFLKFLKESIQKKIKELEPQLKW